MTTFAGAPFTSLAREYYVSDEVYKRELHAVMSQQWHYVAHASEIANPGDYIVETYAGESVLIVRDNDGSVNAFLNICRHRGFTVCQNRSGNVRRFVCAYHRWTYGLDGSLVGAPDMPNGQAIDYNQWGLHRVQTEVWNGLVFICLSKDAKPSVSRLIEDLAPDLARSRPAQWKKADEERYFIDANWKVLLENFLECYHCKGTHPELCAAMDLDGMYEDALHRATGQYSGGMVPLKKGMKTQSLDGELVSMPLGEFRDLATVPSGWGAGFQITPVLTRIIAHVDHATIFTIRPIDAGHVEWVSRWFVHQDAEEGKHYSRDTLTKVWRATNEQDLSLCVGTYRGIGSRYYVPGPLSATREPAIRSAVNTYLELMAEK